MSKLQHTPAPWKVRFLNGKDDGECQFFVEAPKTDPKIVHNIEILGDDFGEHVGYPRQQRLADAQLIAAAPDLLKSLIEAIRDNQTSFRIMSEANADMGFPPPKKVAWLERAEVAIDKATQP